MCGLATHREEQNAFFGHDPWEYGLGERNKLKSRTLIRYSYEQGLISEQPAETAVVLNVSEEALMGTSGF